MRTLPFGDRGNPLLTPCLKSTHPLLTPLYALPVCCFLLIHFASIRSFLLFLLADILSSSPTHPTADDTPSIPAGATTTEPVQLEQLVQLLDHPVPLVGLDAALVPHAGQDGEALQHARDHHGDLLAVLGILLAGGGVARAGLGPAQGVETAGREGAGGVCVGGAAEGDVADGAGAAGDAAGRALGQESGGGGVVGCRARVEGLGGSWAEGMDRLARGGGRQGLVEG